MNSIIFILHVQYIFRNLFVQLIFVQKSPIYLLEHSTKPGLRDEIEVLS